jgi:hypothetical protein
VDPQRAGRLHRRHPCQSAHRADVPRRGHKATYQFQGRARVTEVAAERQRIFERAPAVERAHDFAMLGAAVVVDLDRVEGYAGLGPQARSMASACCATPQHTPFPDGATMNPKDSHDLTHVGPDTVMGNFMRQYWIPAAKSSELQSDGTPMRLLLLGEKLVAFRDSSGASA